MRLHVVRSETWLKIIVVAVWGPAMASIAGQSLLRDAFLNSLDMGLLLLVSFMAGALVSDLGKAILGYFGAVIVASATLYLVAVLPSLTGAVDSANGALLQVLWISILVRAFFPLPFIGILAASLVGAAVGETYL